MPNRRSTLKRVVDATQKVRTLGPRRSAQSARCILEDFLFDRHFGTDTKSPGSIASLDVETASREHAVAYAPTKAGHFHAVMEAYDFPPGSVFVDVGSGKGKVLLLASQYDFERVIGIEFSPDLCRIAADNLAAYERKRPLRAPVEIVLADAGEHPFGPAENVFFLFNPFDANGLRRFLDNLERSLRQHPRVIWIIYDNPVRRSLIQDHTDFIEIGTVEFANTESIIYRSRI